MYKSNKYVLFFLFIISFVNIGAQPELKFERYTVNHGLVQNYVFSIVQDDYGFMWFGTQDGLSRFDGITFKNYTHSSNDSCSIFPGWILSIDMDAKSQLWVGSDSGLVSYNYSTDCFTKYKLNLPEDNKSHNRNFSTILYDSEGLLWTIFSGRLVIFNPDTKEAMWVPQNDNKEIPKIYITFIYEDKNGLIWIGTDNKGLFKYNRINKEFTFYEREPGNPNAISSNFMRCIYEDSKGDIWIGTDKGGLNRYNPSLSLLEKDKQEQVNFEKFLHNPNDPNSLSHNTVYSICEDAEDNLWIGTLNGLCLFDRKSKKFYPYYYDDRDPESLNDNIIRSLYCDKFGNLWVGTRLGVAKLKRNRFKTYKYSSYKSSPSHNKVDYLFADASQNIFICMPVGIDYFNRKHNTFQVFKHVEKGGACLFASPICMESDPGNGYWIGAYDGGLYYYDIKTQNCTAYTHSSEDTSSLGHNSVFSICVDSENTVWIGTWGDGINVFNRETGKFNRIPHDFEDDSKAVCVYEDKDKDIWAGTARGLYLFDKKTRKFKYYMFDEQRNYVGVECLLQDENRNLWIGTDVGLYRVNTKNEENTLYQLEDGLPSLKICSIIEDKNHTIWVSTKNGLARFIPHTEDERKEIPSFKIYGEEDGLQSDFLKRSCCKLDDGAIAFGGSEGLSIFHPDSINEDTVAPKILLTDFKIFNKPVSIGEKINGEIILNQSLLTTDTIKIHYQNNNFTIEFAALHYRNSKLNQYAYKLEGYDNEWNYTTAQNRYATYTDLPYNTYAFSVKASNSDGVWSKETKKLVIYILPPWWLTFWFKILVIFIITSVIVFLFKLKTYKLRKQKKMLEEKVEYRTRQLKEANQILEEGREELQQQAEQLSSMNKMLLETNTNLKIKTTEVENMAKVIHEADQSKLRFFANISHEFRTPLSLIIGPLEKYLNIGRAASFVKVESNYLKLMHQNAKRLLRLINEVIDFRKIDQGEKKLQISNNNIEEFIREVVEAFSAQANQKDISLNVKSIEEDEYKQRITDFWFDPDIMEKILYNLISNAIKYTNKEGNVSVQLSVSSEQLPVTINQSYDSPLNTDNCLLITVKDTGIGIKKENLNKIFERFYREETNKNYTIDGTGIGLAYTKELIELHKGLVSVESEVGKGSIFTLQFPIGKDSFEKQTIKDKSTDVKLDYIHTMMETFEKATNVSEVIELEEKKSDSESNIEKATILVVEDNNDLRKFIKEELGTHYKVLEAENGEKGWGKALKFDPGVIVSDIMMPVMDGMELCKKIKTDENTSHIPVILLTAKTGDEHTIEGLTTGADDYITKPFNPEILRIKIHNLLETRKRLREKFGNSIYTYPEEITTSSFDEEFIRKSLKIVEENLQNIDFNNQLFVSLMGHSKSFIYKKLQNLTNKSLSEFIRTIRLKKAAELLLKGEKNISEIGYSVGFSSPSNFARDFHKMFGKSPSEFIKER